MREKIISEIISENFKPCNVCSKETNKVNIAYECRICSEECEGVLNRQYEEYLRSVDAYDLE